MTCRRAITLLGLIGLQFGAGPAQASCVPGSSRDSLLSEARIALDDGRWREAEQCYQYAERDGGSLAEVYLAWGQALAESGAGRVDVGKKLSRAHSSSITAEERAFYGAHYALFLLEDPVDLNFALTVLTATTTRAIAAFLAGEALYRHGDLTRAATMLLRAEARLQQEGESKGAAAMRAFAALTYADRLKPDSCEADCFSGAWDSAWKVLEPLYTHGGSPVSFSNLIVGWLVKRHEDATAADLVPAWVIALGEDALPEWVTASVESRSRAQFRSELFPDKDVLRPRLPAAKVRSDATDSARTLADGAASTIQAAANRSFDNLVAELDALRAGDIGSPTIETPGWRRSTTDANVRGITVRRTSAAYLHLPLSIEDDRGLVEIHVRLVRVADDSPVWEYQPEPQPMGDRLWRALLAVPLKDAGEENLVVIEATDVRGNTTKEKLDVRHVPKARRRMAYLFGIEDYGGIASKLEGLKKNDVDVLYELISSSESNFTVETKVNEEVSGAAITTVRNKIKGTHEGDEVIFYFSGHGKSEHEGRSGSCLLLHDGSCMLIRDLVPDLTDNAAARVAVILDACFSGDPSHFQLPKDGERVLISGAAWDEKAGFDNGKSVLTGKIQEAIRSANERDDLDRDAMVSAMEIGTKVDLLLKDDHGDLHDQLVFLTAGHGPFVRSLSGDWTASYWLDQAMSEAPERDRPWLRSVRASLESDSDSPLKQVAREILVDRARNHIRSEQEVLTLLRAIKDYVETQ